MLRFKEKGNTMVRVISVCLSICHQHINYKEGFKLFMQSELQYEAVQFQKRCIINGFIGQHLHFQLKTYIPAQTGKDQR